MKQFGSVPDLAGLLTGYNDDYPGPSDLVLVDPPHLYDIELLNLTSSSAEKAEVAKP